MKKLNSIKLEIAHYIKIQVSFLLNDSISDHLWKQINNQSRSHLLFIINENRNHILDKIQENS